MRRDEHMRGAMPFANSLPGGGIRAPDGCCRPWCSGRPPRLPHGQHRRRKNSGARTWSGEERTIYEYRQNGHLRMVKIVPDWGKPYYLVPRDPTAGFGDLERADALLPTWVIVEF